MCPTLQEILKNQQENQLSPPPCRMLELTEFTHQY